MLIFYIYSERLTIIGRQPSVTLSLLDSMSQPQGGQYKGAALMYFWIKLNA